MTEQPKSSYSLGNDVAAAGEAIEQDALKTLAKQQPVRRVGWPAALISVVALALTLWLQFGRSEDSAQLDAESERGALATLGYATSVLQGFADSTGAPPRSLEVVGLGDLPLAYDANATGFRLSIVTHSGDSLAFVSAGFSGSQELK